VTFLHWQRRNDLGEIPDRQLPDGIVIRHRGRIVYGASAR
jgi:hypothetical protein